MSNEPTIEVPIDMVRDLLNGVLSGACKYVMISPHASNRFCIIHQSVESCIAKELFDIYIEEEESLDDFILSEREDWIASPDVDEEQP